jgi:hypothetical protein
MTKEEAQLESLKMTKEWSIWLIALQSSICTFLWGVLKEQLGVLETLQQSGQNYSLIKFQVVVLHFGWLAFAVSVLVAIILVSRMPVLIEQFSNGPDDKPKAYYFSTKTLMTMEYAFFLLGVMFILIFVLRRFLHAI